MLGCSSPLILKLLSQQPGEETEERGSLAERAAAAVSAEDEEHEIVLEKYHRGISHVEGLLKLDKLRQVGHMKILSSLFLNLFLNRIGKLLGYSWIFGQFIT